MGSRQVGITTFYQSGQWSISRGQCIVSRPRGHDRQHHYSTYPDLPDEQIPRRSDYRTSRSNPRLRSNCRDGYGPQCPRLSSGNSAGALMKIGIKLVHVTLAMISATSMLAKPNRWPVIQSLTEKHIFNNAGANGSDTPVVAFVKDTQGVPVYKLECHNGIYDDESEIAFSGDFQCALFAIKGSTFTSGDLLAANTKNELSTDWWNRGRMRSAQLRGECLKYPEYSTDRRFKLRGMLLTLRFTDMQWGPPKDQQKSPVLSGFTLILKVVPDESAHSSRAEVVTGPKPPTACYP